MLRFDKPSYFADHYTYLNYHKNLFDVTATLRSVIYQCVKVCEALLSLDDNQSYIENGIDGQRHLGSSGHFRYQRSNDQFPFVHSSIEHFLTVYLHYIARVAG